MSLLEVQGLEARHGQLQAVRGIDLRLENGECLALVGANGAGKSTLLRAIAGIHQAAAGTVRLEGRDVTSEPAHRRTALGISLVPEGRRLFGSMSVEDNLRVATSSGRKGSWNLDTVLDAFPQLKPKLKSVAASLSGGQQQAVAIGRALMTNPRVLLMDEVSLGLSPAAVQTVYESLSSLMATQTAIILVEQDLQRTFSVANRLVCMLEGKALASGRTTDMTKAEVLDYYFGHRKGSTAKEAA